jgi:acetylornithine deacetylase/succinyl-diaminopimelate desuccinylase-like protein
MRHPFSGAIMGIRRTLAFMLATGIAASVAAADNAGQGRYDAKARELFARVISMPTSKGNAQVPAMVEYLAGEFRAAGFPAADVVVVPFKGTGDATASLVVRYRSDGKGSNGGKGGKPIALLAHMDVVTAKREDWERNPFELIEENGFFYGRGTYDNKQGVVALTATFLRLKAEGFVPTRDLIIYFSGDEETAQETTASIVREHRALVDAEYALNSDAGGGVLDDATGKPLYFSFQTAEKTYADFTLTVRNPGGHSSQPRADNAIYDLAAALGKVRAYQFPVMSNPTTLASLKQQGEMTPGELGVAVKKFAENPNDAAAAQLISQSPSFVGQTRTTCVATMLNGGHAENALPQSASANVNCRIFPGVKIEDVRVALQQAAGKDVEIKLVGEPLWSDASPLRPDLVKAVTRAVNAIQPGVPVVPLQTSGATDGLLFRAAGIPTYGIDGNFMKPDDDFSHGLNERIGVRSFYDSLKFWHVLLKDLAGKRR